MSRTRMPDDQVTPGALIQRRYRENPENRLKALIRNRIHHALKRGRLVKSPCICGNREVEAHHHKGYDLEHALDVVWLCKRHHEVLHPHRSRSKKASAA
jgi:hypothetical protein